MMLWFRIVRSYVRRQSSHTSSGRPPHVLGLDVIKPVRCYNLLPYLTAKEAESPRKEFYYFSDDGNVLAMRYNRWKLHFSIQEHRGYEVWSRGFTNLRVPLIIDIEAHLFERTWEHSELYRQWQTDHVFLLVPAQESRRNSFRP
jgi:hypothetical protein